MGDTGHLFEEYADFMRRCTDHHAFQIPNEFYMQKLGQSIWDFSSDLAELDRSYTVIYQRLKKFNGRMRGLHRQLRIAQRLRDNQMVESLEKKRELLHWLQEIALKSKARKARRIYKMQRKFWRLVLEGECKYGLDEIDDDETDTAESDIN